MTVRTHPPVGGLRALAAMALGAGLAWMLGLLWFVHLVNRPPDPPTRADGIVAWTGGADRVDTALRLLAEGRGGALLLSGIGGGAELAELARHAGVDPTPLADRVTLGRAATTTHGNAEETADWARRRGLRSLILVTAGYHMPRAVAELRRVLPDVALYRAPVSPPGMRGPAGMRDMAMLRLVAGEYTKWIAASAGLTELESRPDPPSPGAPVVQTRGSADG